MIDDKRMRHADRTSAVAVMAALLLASTAARGASAEDAYLAARDRRIAALAKIKNSEAQDLQNEKASKDLAQKLKPLLGPLPAPGFPAEGRLNIESLIQGDEGFGMLDGLAYGEDDGDRRAVATTDGLLDRWLSATRKDEPQLPAAASDAATNELFYTLAVSTGAAVVAYGELSVSPPAGTKFAHAMLTARTQDESPNAPEEIFVALEKGGRVFFVNEKLKTPIKPIAACDELKAAGVKKAEAAAEKAYATSGPEGERLGDEAIKLRDQADSDFRACFRDKVKDAPERRAAEDQAAAIVAAFSR